MALNLSDVECVAPLGCLLGEGPLWHEDALWFVDIKRLAIHRFDPESGKTRSWTAPAQPGFLAPAASGGFVAGLQTGLHHFDPTTGAFALLAQVEPDRPGNRLNDGAVDGWGRLWFGSMDDGESLASGRVYRLDGTTPVMVDQDIAITNGPTVSPDGRTFYHTDTLAKTVYAYDLTADGGLDNKRPLIRIEEGAGYPDGTTVDAEGGLWIGLYDGWAVRRYGADGALLGEVGMPCANITKVAFGGRDLDTVYVTTAAKGLDPAALARQPLAGGVFRFQSAVAGLPQQAVSGV